MFLGTVGGEISGGGKIGDSSVGGGKGGAAYRGRGRAGRGVIELCQERGTGRCQFTRVEFSRRLPGT